MSTSFNPAFLPVRDKRGRPYSNTYRLWRHGHRIQGKTAWRIQSQEFVLPYVLKRGGRKLHHHAKYRAGRIWVNFTSEDFVYVRQGDGDDKKYHRVWWLPFLAQVWVARKCDLWATFSYLQRYYGLRVGRNYGIKYLKAALYGHVDEIKEYILATKQVDLDKYIERHDKVLQWAESKLNDSSFKTGEQLEAANLAERGLGRMVSVFTEAEKKGEAAQSADASQKKFFGILERIAEKNGGPHTDEEPASS